MRFTLHHTIPNKLCGVVGELNRKVAETAMNNRSSRSHAVFTVYLSSRKGDLVVRYAFLKYSAKYNTMLSKRNRSCHYLIGSIAVIKC